MKLAIILGTRPEIIKMAPVIWECERRHTSYFVIHTGQHYTPFMDEIFFTEMSLDKPKYNLGLGQLPYRKQVGFFIPEIMKVLSIEKPDVVLVQGDTISVLAGALAATKLGIAVAHHEAGLRSYDTTMLEEVNRTITDHMSEFLCTPTSTATENLIEEGFPKERIFQTGNTIVDVIKHFESQTVPSRLDLFNLRPKEYFLVTAHRAENVDNIDRLSKIIKGLSLLRDSFPSLDILLPLHPRTRKRLEQFKLEMPKGIKIIEPVGFIDLLTLEKYARLVITDSGGMQEESCVVQVPTVTIRDNTERPETVSLGMNCLVPGLEPLNFLESVQNMLNKNYTWVNPFGVGDAGGKIVDLFS